MEGGLNLLITRGLIEQVSLYIFISFYLHIIWSLALFMSIIKGVVYKDVG